MSLVPAYGSPPALGGFRVASLITLLLLLLQFLIGMWVNLFVTPPKSHPGRNASEYFGGVAQVTRWALGHATVILRLHVILGLLLVIMVFVVIGIAIRTRGRTWLGWSLLGAFGVGAAGFNGASFLNYGNDFSSMLMSAGFAVAVAAYMAALYATG